MNVISFLYSYCWDIHMDWGLLVYEEDITPDTKEELNKSYRKSRTFRLNENVTKSWHYVRNKHRFSYWFYY
jgi:hypothetical protein